MALLPILKFEILRGKKNNNNNNNNIKHWNYTLHLGTVPFPSPSQCINILNRFSFVSITLKMLKKLYYMIFCNIQISDLMLILWATFDFPPFFFKFIIYSMNTVIQCIVSSVACLVINWSIYNAQYPWFIIFTKKKKVEKYIREKKPEMSNVTSAQVALYIQFPVNWNKDDYKNI